MTDIMFDWERMLDFTGDSGPYLQYTYARLKSILRKVTSNGEPVQKLNDADVARLGEVNEMELMRKLFEFPDAVARASETYSTSVIAVYLHKLAVAANKFYETTPILKDENVARRAARLALTEVAARTLAAGLGLLGITALEKI
jgi:arginyl-tRNA synthetase